MITVDRDGFRAEVEWDRDRGVEIAMPAIAGLNPDRMAAFQRFIEQDVQRAVHQAAIAGQQAAIDVAGLRLARIDGNACFPPQRSAVLAAAGLPLQFGTPILQWQDSVYLPSQPRRRRGGEPSGGWHLRLNGLPDWAWQGETAHWDDTDALAALAARAQEPDAILLERALVAPDRVADARIAWDRHHAAVLLGQRMTRAAHVPYTGVARQARVAGQQARIAVSPLPVPGTPHVPAVLIDRVGSSSAERLNDVLAGMRLIQIAPPRSHESAQYTAVSLSGRSASVWVSSDAVALMGDDRDLACDYLVLAARTSLSGPGKKRRAYS